MLIYSVKFMMLIYSNSSEESAHKGKYCHYPLLINWSVSKLDISVVCFKQLKLH